jgi:lipoate-protein ligase A
MEQQRIRDALDRGVDRPYVLGWRYASPALVLGRGQRGSAELLERAERERLAVVTRASGGGAVMAGPWMLGVTLLLPAVHPLARGSLPAGYRAVGESCRRALRRLRVPTQLAGAATVTAATPPAPGGAVRWACFACLSHGELAVAGGGKILGIAQVRRRDATAVCIGVLVGRPDWEALVRVWCGREDPGILQELERRTASCDQFVPACGDAFVDALAAALEAELAAPRLAA